MRARWTPHARELVLATLKGEGEGKAGARRGKKGTPRAPVALSRLLPLPIPFLTPATHARISCVL